MMSEEIPSEARLSGSALVGTSCRFARSHITEIAAIILFPAALSLLLSASSLAFAGAESENFIFYTAVSLLHVVPWTLFGVALHRRILLNAAATIASSISWSRSHTAFATYLVIWQLPYLFFPKTASGSPLMGVWVFGGVVVFFLLPVLQAKFAIFLPATAVGESISPTEAWKRSTGYVGAIFWSGFLSACLSLILVLSLYLAAAFLFPDFSAATVFVSFIGWVTFETISVGPLSFAYRRIATDMAET